MVVPPTAKSLLRNDLKKRRQDFVKSQNAFETALALRDIVLEHSDAPRIISAYLPIRDEIDPLPIIEALAARGVVIALPYLANPRAPMRFVAWRPGEALEAGPFGLMQPSGQTDVIPDMILTPLLGFDRTLHRIGYGAGHYDGAFARYPAARRIGLAWSVQQCESIPVEAHDVSLHAVATEREWIS